MKQSKNGQEKRPVLSICMIVKNEEENLERCLRSLRPLMEGVASELIITDTGSTDRTVEVARRYTDHILHFPWCGDFSAARNTGLEAAKGEWAMIIDADEELSDDLSELIRFFNSKLRYQFVRASAIMKNVINPLDRDAITNEQNVNHFFRMDTNPRFEGRIHETVELMSPLYQFGFIGYHYGYAYRNEAEKEAKQRRNMTMIRKELEERPEDLRLLLSALMSVRDQEERRELIERTLEAARVHPQSIWMTSGYKHVAEEYLDLKQWEDVLRICGEFQSSPAFGCEETKIAMLDIYYAMATAAFNLQKYEDGIQYCDQYLQLYKDYEDGKVKRLALMFIAVNSLYDLRFNKAVLMKTEMLYRLSKPVKAAKQLCQLRENRLDQTEMSELFNLAVILMQQDRVELPAGRFYLALKQMEEQGKGLGDAAREIYATLEARLACCSHKNQIKMAGLFLQGAEGRRDDFLNAMELIHNQETMGQAELSDKLLAYMEGAARRDRILPELYYLAFVNRVKIPDEAYQLDVARMKVVTDHILAAHQGELQVLTSVGEAWRGGDGMTAYEATLKGDLLEKAVRLLEKADRESRKAEKTQQEQAGQEEQKISEEFKRLEKSLLRSYGELMDSLLVHMYQPVMLNDGYVNLMPVFHQRGYWLGQGFRALDAKNYERAMKCMKALVKCDKTMKELAGLFIEIYEEQKTSQIDARKSAEFRELAVNVKSAVRQMIKDGDDAQAFVLLKKLEALCPDDQEIKSLVQSMGRQ